MVCKRMHAFMLLFVFLVTCSAFAQEIGVIPIGPNIPGQGGRLPTAQLSPSAQAPGQSTGGFGPASGIGQTMPGQPGQSAGAPSSFRGALPSKARGTLVRQGAVAASKQIPGEELSDIEKFMSGKAPQELIFDIKQFGYDLFYVSPSTMASPAVTEEPPGAMPSFGQGQAPITEPAPANGAGIGMGSSLSRGQYSGQGSSSPPAGQSPTGEPASSGGLPSNYGALTAGGASPSYSPSSRRAQSYAYAPPSTFAPGQYAPVGPDYVIGPGDEIRINVWGGIEGNWNLTVDRDGTITLPKIGTIGVTGLTFDEAKQMLQKEFSKSYTDFQMNVSMGQLRTVRVYVVGNARRPGAYSISSISTLINALFESGGPAKVGTLRDLQLLRNGETLVHLDLYDFLLKGNKTGDMRLMPEDVIFIPPIGPIAGIAGNVKVPAIYELKGKTRVSELIKMAGGVNAKAYLQRVQVERVFENKSKIVVDLDLQRLKDKNDIFLNNGDLVKIFPITPDIENQVVLQGNVWRPGEYQWKEGMRVRDVIKSTKDLQPEALMDTARIDRLVPPDYHEEYKIFNLGRLLLESDERENVELRPYDVVTVFNKWEMKPKEVVRTEGALNRPGEFEYRQGMKLSDLMNLSGGPRNYAFMEKAELTRITPTPEGPKTEKIIVYPANALNGDPIDDIPLQQDDYLFVRAVPEWELYRIVTIEGEVKYPGRYTVQSGEKLSSVLARAGGFTDKAYLRGAVFTRLSIKQSQQAQLKEMADRLEREVLASSSAEAGTALGAEEGQVLVAQGKAKAQFIQNLRQAEAKGRMVIALEAPQKLKGTSFDVTLENGDTLFVPETLQTVQVVGAVYNQTSFLYSVGKDFTYYVKMCGGYTKSADKKSLYIVKVNGSAARPKGALSWSNDSNQWNLAGGPLEPGDTIVVPDNLEKVAWLRNIKDITQILANVATSAGMVFVGLRN